MRPPFFVAATSLTLDLRRAKAWICLATLMLVFLQGCASLQPLDKPESRAIPLQPNTTLGGLASRSLGSSRGSAFRALPVSAYSMDARLALVKASQRSIDLQYYLLQNDATGQALVREVRDAAERGVRVRILVDDLYTTSSARMLRDLAAYENVEVRLFNPFPSGRAFSMTRWAFSLFDFARVNHRMHNKMLVADGAFAIAGGRNMADEYFFRSDTANFIDFDILLAGPAVTDLASIFDTYWNSQHVYPIEHFEGGSADSERLRTDLARLLSATSSPFPALKASDRDLLGYPPLSSELDKTVLPMLHGDVRVIADDPEKVSGRSESGNDPTTVTYRAMDAFSEARSELLLISPYFVPGQLGLRALGSVRHRDVAVTVVTNSLAANDEPFASAAYARYRKTILKMGVELYEISARPLELAGRYGGEIASIGRSHAKIAVIDRRTTFIGSMNMDFRSSRTNTEVGLFVDSDELSRQVCSLTQSLIASDAYHVNLDASQRKLIWTFTENGSTSVLDEEPEVGVGTRLKLFLFSPLVPESLL
jgi:putative cardiolipin synthase